jgi:sugar phosphate isomerase/epimerase
MITISAFADEIGPDLELQMQTCAAQGVRCIDVRGIDGKNCSAMTPPEAEAYRRRLDDGGFTVPCLGSPIGKIRMDEDFDAHLDSLRHCGAVARAFGTNRIRVFSFYPSEGKAIADERDGVMERMAAMVRVAEAEDLVLYHENEKAIYGGTPAGVKDIFATVASDRLLGIFDPANYVEEGIRPFDEGWAAGLGDRTHYFHIKDKRPGDRACAPAGEGAGQFEEIFRDLAARDWSGFMTLEPHLAAAGQFSGFTGPDLFARAVGALKGLLDGAGLAYRKY